MGLWNKTIIPVLSLLSFCRPIETTGLCRFEAMFPNEGKTEYWNGGTVEQDKVTQQSTITPCPPNMVHGNCTCVATCEDPAGNTGCYNSCIGEASCVCQDGFLMKDDLCVPQIECGCFLSEAEKVIPNMESYVLPDCLTRCSCVNYELVCETFGCGSNSVCREKNNTYEFYCEDGFIGDGQNCTLRVTDCLDVFNTGFNESGVYLIKPNTWSGPEFEVFCNMDDGGGWTVFQRRVNGSVDFYRDWEDYKQGFGFLDHEFWLGNDKIYSLTDQRNYTLRIDLVNSLGSPLYALYKQFQIASENDMYYLKNADIYSGTVGFDAMERNKGDNFSTWDRDNDDSIDENCAIEQHGGWWFKNCGHLNLNGGYFHSKFSSIRWKDLVGDAYNIKFTEMKIRS